MRPSVESGQIVSEIVHNVGLRTLPIHLLGATLTCARDRTSARFAGARRGLERRPRLGFGVCGRPAEEEAGRLPAAGFHQPRHAARGVQRHPVQTRVRRPAGAPRHGRSADVVAQCARDGPTAEGVRGHGCACFAKLMAGTFVISWIFAATVTDGVRSPRRMRVTYGRDTPNCSASA